MTLSASAQGPITTEFVLDTELHSWMNLFSVLLEYASKTDQLSESGPRLKFLSSLNI